MEKRCFKCCETKPIPEFYKHGKMADGHLGKCKTCTKKDTAERVARLSKNPVWLKKERCRHRNKQAGYRANGTAAPCKQEYRRKWAMNNPHKINAQKLAKRALKQGFLKMASVCQRCGASGVRLEKHHPDYSSPLKVEWLCSKCHGATRHKDGHLDVIP